MRDPTQDNRSPKLPAADGRMWLAVYHVDRAGTRMVKPPELFAGTSAAWPFGDGSMGPNPPCKCSPGCRFPDPCEPPRALP